VSVTGDGWLVLEGLLAPSEVDAVRAELSPLLDAAPWGANSFVGRRTKRVFGLPAKARTLDPVITHERVLAEVASVLGPGALLSTAVAVEIHPGESAQTPHDDGGAWPVPGPILVNAIWALDDFTADNGATVLGGRPVEMPAGSVLVYRGDVEHGGGANTTERPRQAVILGDLAPWLRQQEAFTLTCPPALARTLPAELQRLLGYALHPPFVGHVDGRDPGELLR
jgi:ectoine hydroxylase-related dioxygenase (phytanoyl-CoA dioxygenase family)